MLIDDSETRIGGTKNLNCDEKKVWCHEILISCCTTVLFLSIFFDFSSTVFKNLSISLFLRAKVEFSCSWFVVQNWRIPLQNDNIFLIMEALDGITILSLRIELIECSVLIIHCDSWILCSIISPLFPLRPLVGLRLPSKVSSFSHSDSQSLPQLSPFCSELNTRRRSFFMLVLSHSDTHNLNRHIAWCGCHEILTQRCSTVLILANFSMYRIQLWFWWLSYSNPSIQLFNIQHSVHHSDLARNHQSCNQKPFILVANWRQTHIQRHISCCHSNQAHEFIAIDSARNSHSSAKLKALVVLERSQKYLPNNSKYRRHETMTDKQRYPLAGWFRAHILDRIQCIILFVFSFRIRCAVVSNTSLSQIMCLNANELRTYSDGS